MCVCHSTISALDPVSNPGTAIVFLPSEKEKEERSYCFSTGGRVALEGFLRARTSKFHRKLSCKHGQETRFDSRPWRFLLIFPPDPKGSIHGHGTFFLQFVQHGRPHRWFNYSIKKKKRKAGRGDRTPDLPLTKRLPCHLAIPAILPVGTSCTKKS